VASGIEHELKGLIANPNHVAAVEKRSVNLLFVQVRAIAGVQILKAVSVGCQ